jgi:hypothetical protein
MVLTATTWGDEYGVCEPSCVGLGAGDADVGRLVGGIEGERMDIVLGGRDYILTSRGCKGC